MSPTLTGDKPNTPYIITDDGTPVKLQGMIDYVTKQYAEQNKKRTSGGKGELIDDGKWTADYKHTANLAAENMKTMLKIIMKKKASAELLEMVIDKQDESVSMNASSMNWNNPGAAGYFFEEFLFGLKKDDKQTADLDKYLGQGLSRSQAVEIKTKSILDAQLDVGGITVYGLDKEIDDAKQKDLKTIALVYKLLIKMRNLLYIYAIKKPETKRLGFKAITLYTELYIKAVYDWINDKTLAYYKVTPHKSEDSDGTVHMQYEIYMNLKVDDFLGGLAKLQKLYMTRIDLLNEIREERISAREFFGQLGILEGYKVE